MTISLKKARPSCRLCAPSGFLGFFIDQNRYVCSSSCYPNIDLIEIMLKHPMKRIQISY